MPNPSTFTEGLHESLYGYRQDFNNLRLSKETRERALRQIRLIEDELDLPEAERTPAYNSGQPAGARQVTDAEVIERIEAIMAITDMGRGQSSQALKAAQLDDIANLLHRRRVGTL